MAAGGMGMIYRATETRLERTVALKFLPPFLRDDSSSRARFVREARAIASIDHQNVCPVYEIDEADGFIFIAMAYLEGMPLDEKLRSGPLPLEQAMGIVLQAAHGLKAAHAKGIVHRDVKPANLMLIDEGRAEPLVRILDFGIAQWTRKSVLTHEGLTIGTASYMAPEQVAGSRVDPRADIWSLGVVFFEMLVGRVPFAGSTVRETLAAIAGPQAIDLHPLQRIASERVTCILRKMLDKEPARRYQSAGELISDLESARGRALPSLHAGSRPIFKRRWAVTALALSGLALLTVILPDRKEWRPGTAPKLLPFTYYPGYQEDPAISPDQKEIAFVSQGNRGTDPLDVYVQLIGSTDPLRLTHGPVGSAERSPVWNPVATTIAFLRTLAGERFARILTISVLGGAETDLGVERALGTGRLAWNPNGRTLAFTGLDDKEQSAIFELSFADHKIRQRSFPAYGQSDCCPQYDPRGDRLAFRRNEVEIVVTGKGGEGVRALPVRVSWPGLTWTADGRSLAYSWFGKIAEVNVQSGSITTPAEALGSDISDITIRGSRTALVRWTFEHSIWKLDLRAGEENRAGVQLIASTMREDTPQFSPDGQWIAFASERSGSTDIWIGRSDGSDLRRLTYLEGHAGTPRWSPDGKWIVFDLRPPSSKPDIWLVRVAGGETRQLASITGGGDVPSWSQDGRWIYFHMRSDDQIWKKPWQGGEAVQVTHQGGFEGFESVDAKYLYYSKGGEHSGIWRVDLANGSEAPIGELSEAGDYRHWALGSRGIYFVRNDEALSNGATVRFFNFGTRKMTRVATVGKLVTAGPGALAVSRDESSLLYVHVDRDNRNIMLVENFR
jgi:serine/threonine protein kinase